MTAAAVAASAFLAGVAGAQGFDSSSWKRPFEPFRIIGNIHYVGTEELGAFLITTPEGHLLLDGVLPESAALLEESIRSLGFDLRDVKYLLNSQAHFDHVGSLSALKAGSGAQVLVMTGDEGLVAAGGKGGFVLGDRVSFPPVPVDRVLRDGDTIALGGTTLTARHTPGHTPGCTTWTTTVEEGGRRYVVAFPGSTSVLPGMRLAGTGLREQFERTFAVLEQLEPDVYLAAHASFFDLAGKRARQKAGAEVNPFIDPEGYRAFIARKKKEFEAALGGQLETR
ncbi:MAG TPA: subclass B3 metallo-beta-lactamase [Methylomirabilota bacterium]